MSLNTPKIRSGSLEGFEALVLKHGGKPAHIFEAVGLNPAVTRQPDTTIPYASVADVLEIAAQVSKNELFGLELGSLQGLGTIGALGLVAAQQATLADAIELTSKHIHLHANGAQLSIQPYGNNTLIRFDLDLPQAHRIEQLEQLSVALALKVTSALAGPNWHAQMMIFKQSPKQLPIEPKQQNLLNRFNCPIIFNQPYSGIIILNDDLKLPPFQDEKLLQQHFTQHLQKLESTYPNQLISQVKNGIANLLPTGECTIENIAATMGIQPRVLQKRLKNQASNFRLILEQTRQEIAQEHLKNATMSITDLALQLGYAEVAVFSRSFKKWTGQSPNAWRKDNVEV